MGQTMNWRKGLMLGGILLVTSQSGILWAQVAPATTHSSPPVVMQADAILTRPLAPKGHPRPPEIPNPTISSTAAAPTMESAWRSGTSKTIESVEVRAKSATPQGNLPPPASQLPPTVLQSTPPRELHPEQLVTLTAAKLTPQRTVHAADPIPTNAAMLPVSLGKSAGKVPTATIIQVGCASCGPGGVGGVGGPGGGGSFAGPDLYGALNSISDGMVGDDTLGHCMDSHCSGVDANGCCVSNCYPLRAKCYDYEDDHIVHRMIGLAYEIICCPDPFYELSGPHWVPAANAAFFTENAQPRGMTKVRWDAGQNVGLPDRNAYFFAQANGTGIGPNPLLTAANNPGQIPKGIASVNYDDLLMYVETATKNGKFSAFATTKYRSVDPDVTPRDGGFGDVEVGTKSLLFDRELIQIALQMKTFLPSGVPSDGTGTGHVSLEPSILLNVKLDEDLYWQSQVAEWIPFGAPYGAGILMLNNSLNKVIWRLNPDVSLIATGEFIFWGFQGGQFTDPATLLPQSSSGGRYYSIAPGLRICFRNFIDFGFGTCFALTGTHYADELYRLEGRLMY